MADKMTFYPGPSKVHEDIPRYTKDAYKAGILSINHRSDAFIDLNKKTQELLRKKLNIPADYIISYTSSATECWEIIAQSFITDQSYHFYNGAFGEKWFQYTKKICPMAIGYRYDIDQELKINELDLQSREAVICLTQNETSNGTQVSNDRIKKIKNQYPDHLVAVDATSSMAGIKLDFDNADIWYASVQKCFGLPAGMGIMICSPQAVAHAEKVGENNHYNSFNFILKNSKLYQTPYTPNVLGIYLLMRTLEKSPGIEKIEKRTIKYFKKYLKLIGSVEGLSLMTDNKAVLSYTVMAIKAQEEFIQRVHSAAEESGIILGKGYGSYKSESFRIANFPAIKPTEIKSLILFLEKFTKLDK